MYPVSRASLIAVCALAVLAGHTMREAVAGEDAVAKLPDGVRTAWGLENAHREATPTRERISINGLWRWQPTAKESDAVPAGRWGHFKVPGCWPGISDYMQKDCQTVFAHPSWQNDPLADVSAAWYQREITVPDEWTGRRIVLEAQYVNSLGAVYIDGKKVGEIRFPSGEVDLSAVCRPGGEHVLSILVVAMPLKAVMLSYNDTASARQVKGRVARRGLCGDVFLASEPKTARICDVKVDTSVRDWSIGLDVRLEGLADDAKYVIRAVVVDGERTVLEFGNDPFRSSELKNGRIALAEKWKPEKLWDVHTPENMYRVQVFLTEVGGRVEDVGTPVRFGFREFWIEGRDFYLNGKRVFLSSVPLDNAQVGAAWATYDGARESMERLAGFGINFVYTHNYGCEPGSHLSFEEILKAADDTGMLIALSQPHFAHYDWNDSDADSTNGYVQHAEFYVRVAQNHPSVVFYSTSHNATGYSEDMNPDMIDGKEVRRSEGSLRNVARARRAEAIIKSFDSSRIVYHHSSGSLGSMHTVNFYANFVPTQEMSDWFEHWATEGVKPIFTCEYTVPMSWDWTMYRGWYQGTRTFGSATVPWEFCLAQWNAQFFGDRAYQISEAEKRNLRWEAKQFNSGRLWHRWDYPHHVGSRDFTERFPVYARYFSQTWPAFRTWGLSANSPWSHGQYWTPRKGVDKSRQELNVDWDNLGRPGFSPDYIDDRYERIDLAFEREDWIPTVAAEALIRYNRPLLAYIAGRPTAFTSKDHNFRAGEVVEKQLIVINNSRETVTCDCEWSLGLRELSPGLWETIAGTREVSVEAGGQERIPLRFSLPKELAAGTYQLRGSFRFGTGEEQADSFAIDVLPPAVSSTASATVALFDPQKETGRLLDEMGIQYRDVSAKSDLSAYDVLVVGKNALSANEPAPDVSGVRKGLKVLLFEQAPEVLEARFGFRVATYGLRRVFKRVPDHPVLAGIDETHLGNWRGEATIVPPRLDYRISRQFGAPTVKWAGIPVTRLWRCGNRGNVATALIEKPARGDFLPIIDGGYGLQYSPLLEYREGSGMVLFCQMDVTGRTEKDPAAEALARNLLKHVAEWKPVPRRAAVYVGDDAGKQHLERAGLSLKPYQAEKLAADDVLVVGAGGGRELVGDATSIADWIDNGGHILALGLDEEEANAFLPMKVEMKNAEHIAAYFEPFGVDSLLAGVCPGDVHNAAPRELPLVTGDAIAIGNGVLGKAEGANVVFCQIPPYGVSKARGTVPSLAVSEADAVEGTRSVLVTMGTVPWGQLGQKVDAPTVGKTYTFAVFVKGVGGPVQARLEIERAGSPWDRVLRGEDTTIGADEWTELHATFKVEKPYPEGWSAYVHCPQEGGRFLADRFRLYEGEHLPGRTAAASQGKNLLKNPSFEEGTEPWSFTYRTEQGNLKRTYRRTCVLLTRLLGNMGVAGEVPLLERFSTPVGGGGGESLANNGDFSKDADGDDEPDEWTFSGSKGASCKRERLGGEGGGWSLLLAALPTEGDKKPNVMLAQHDIPITKGQWYRISLNARSEDLEAGSVTATITNMATWRSLLPYERFSPGDKWEKFSFEAQASDTVQERTRFQIWYTGEGRLWLSDVRVEPIDDPTKGRWLEGLYLDTPQEWDDPYRFFRW